MSRGTRGGRAGGGGAQAMKDRRGREREEKRRIGPGDQVATLECRRK
jgi:hypothetical protein